MAPNAAPFTDDALAKVAVPVRVYGAERDDLTLVRHHAERLAKALPPGTEYVLVKQAGHFSFVASFPWALKIVAGEAAQDPEGFDRDAMHEVMNLEIVGFFDRKLGLATTRASDIVSNFDGCRDEIARHPRQTAQWRCRWAPSALCPPAPGYAGR